MSRQGTQSTLNLGWINYWSLRPLLVELVRHFGEHLNTVKGTPQAINSLLSGGDIGIASCSSVNLILNPHLNIAAPIGVCSDGPQINSYIGINESHSAYKSFFEERTAQVHEVIKGEIDKYINDARTAATKIWTKIDLLPAPKTLPPPRIYLADGAATGTMLTRIFYRMMFGPEAFNNIMAHAELIRSTDRPSKIGLELLVGNDAMIRRPMFENSVDLGAWWHSTTGLPLVQSILQVNPMNRIAIPTAKIIDCAIKAQATMKIDPSQYFFDNTPHDCHGKPIHLQNLWRHIHYKIGQKDMRGLLLFLSLGRHFLHQEFRQKSAIKIMKWQNICEVNYPELH
jgi:predicted solute-binding protein